MHGVERNNDNYLLNIFDDYGSAIYYRLGGRNTFPGHISGPQRSYTFPEYTGNVLIEKLVREK